MDRQYLSILISFIRKFFFFIYSVFIFHLTVNAQAVYVDSNTGNDNNNGTIQSPFFSIQKALEIIKNKDNDIYVMKINPGIYILDNHITISTQKNLDHKRIIIEASVLPEDTSWTPEKMPVVISKSRKGDIPEYYHFVAAFLVDESHVTIRGIKFPGYFYPNTRYFPIARFNKEKTDLLVEQCMFVGDRNASHIQVGVIAHGDEIKIDHCVFYNAKNAAVYWESSGEGNKTGNSFTNNIVHGAFQCAVWLAWPDNDFIIKNNIITNCKHAWIKNDFNKTKYSIDNCYVVSNEHYQGVTSDTGVVPETFEMNETNIIKEGNISLRMMDDNVDVSLPVDYLHIAPGTPGFDIGAGLFKK